MYSQVICRVKVNRAFYISEKIRLDTSLRLINLSYAIECVVKVYIFLWSFVLCLEVLHIPHHILLVNT